MDKSKLINDWILFLYNQYDDAVSVLDIVNEALKGNPKAITRKHDFRNKISFYDLAEIVAPVGAEQYIRQVIEKTQSSDGMSPAPRNILNSYIEYAFLKYGNVSVVINQLENYIKTQDVNYITADYNYRESIPALLKSGKMADVIGSDISYIQTYVANRIDIIKRRIVDSYIQYASEKYSYGSEVIYSKIDEALGMYRSGEVTAITRDKGFRGKFITYGITKEDIDEYLGRDSRLRYDLIKQKVDEYKEYRKEDKENIKEIIRSAFYGINGENGQAIVDAIDKGMSGDFSDFGVYSNGLNRLIDYFKDYVYDHSGLFEQVTLPNKKGIVEFSEIGFKTVSSITSELGKSR